MRKAIAMAENFSGGTNCARPEASNGR